MPKVAVAAMLVQASVEAAVGGPISQMSTDFFSYIVNHAVGNSVEPETDPVKELVEKKRGDTEALMQAITPALKRSHNIIGNGAGQIIIIQGDNNIVQLDSNTKSYINSDRTEANTHTKLVSVGRMNGNQRDVGVYDQDEGRVITGYIPVEASARTMGNLGRSLTIFVEGDRENSWLYIRYRKVTDPNGRILRYLIFDAWFAGDAAREGGRLR